MNLQPRGRIGSFELESAIGEGGLGDVWKAHDISTGRLVALRILPPPPPRDPFRFARFDADIRKVIALRHPNVAQVYELIDTGDIRALACEWVTGESLATRIAAGPIPVDEAVQIIAQIASGLAAAHARDLVHGDIKPSNIALCPDGMVKMLDVGLVEIYDAGAAMSHSEAKPATSARLLNAITGTAAYMSPEQIAGHAADSRADVWAFGCVVYEMLTRTPAFAADDLTDTMARVTSGEPEWTLLPPTAPPVLVQTLRRCLERDPLHRFQRMTDVLAPVRESTDEPGVFDADDLVRDVLTRVIERAPVRHGGVIQRYLLKSVQKRIRDEIRRDPLRSLADLPECQEAIKGLSERDRALLESYFEKHEGYDEIATRFSLRTAAAARMAVTRALHKLAELVAKKGG